MTIECSKNLTDIFMVRWNDKKHKAFSVGERDPIGEMLRPVWSCRTRVNKQIIIWNKYNYKLILKIQLN